jgi:hypothetical protein
MIDLSNLSPVGRDWYDRLDSALRTEIGRRLPDTWTADDAHKAAYIAVQTADVVMRERIDEQVAKKVKEDPAEAVAEALFDQAHEGCDDEEGCQGGGRPWYDAPAKKLTDPASAVVGVAIEHQLLVDELGDLAKEAGDDAGWMATLRAGAEDVGRAWDACAAGEASTNDVRREALQLAAWCVALVEELDRRAHAKVAGLVREAS